LIILLFRFSHVVKIFLGKFYVVSRWGFIMIIKKLCCLGIVLGVVNILEAKIEQIVSDFNMASISREIAEIRSLGWSCDSKKVIALNGDNQRLYYDIQTQELSRSSYIYGSALKAIFSALPSLDIYLHANKPGVVNFLKYKKVLFVEEDAELGVDIIHSKEEEAPQFIDIQNERRKNHEHNVSLMQQWNQIWDQNTVASDFCVNKIRGLKFSPITEQLLITLYSGQIFFLKKGFHLEILNFNYNLLTCALDPLGDRYVVATEQLKLIIGSLSNTSSTIEFDYLPEGASGLCRSLALSQSGIFVGLDDGRILVFQERYSSYFSYEKAYIKVQEISLCNNVEINSMALQPGGKILAVGLANQVIFFVNTTDFSILDSNVVDAEYIAWSGDGKFCAAINKAGDLSIFQDITEGSIVEQVWNSLPEASSLLPDVSSWWVSASSSSSLKYKE
jgi:hypothetical protein